MQSRNLRAGPFPSRASRRLASEEAPVYSWSLRCPPQRSGEYSCSTSIVSPLLAAPLSRNLEVTPFVRLFAELSLNQVILSPRLANKPALSLAFWCVPLT